MGYSLALVTTITLGPNQRPDNEKIGSAIEMAVRKHVQKRFNKLRFAHESADLLDPRL